MSINLERKCNKYGCGGAMRPTRRMWDLDGDIPKPTHRYYRCTTCGNETPWLDKPNLKNIAGALHNMPEGGISGLSLMSDPFFYPPKRVRPTRPVRS